MKKQAIIIILSLILIVNLKAQNEIRNDNSSGFNIQMQLISKNNTTFIGAFPGYTLNGQWDFGLGVGFQNHEDYNVEGISIYPWVEYMFLKQDDGNLPLSVELGYQFSFTNFDKIQLNQSTHSLYLATYHSVALNDDFQIIPGASFSINNTTIDLDSFRDVDTGFAYTIEVALVMQKFWIKPYLRFFDRTNNVGFWIGYTF